MKIETKKAVISLPDILIISGQLVLIFHINMVGTYEVVCMHASLPALPPWWYGAFRRDFWCFDI